MRIMGKWLLWYTAISCYVMVLGGVFYYNLFTWTFDEKLKQDMVETVRLKSQELLTGLLANPKVISMPEYDVMDFLRNDKRITEILYLNGNGTIRWHKQGNFIGLSFDEYEKSIGLPTDAIAQAFNSGSPKVRKFPNQPFYEVAIPFKAKGDVVMGILSLQVSREESERVIRSAMQKYIVGAIGVMLLLGIPLYIFMMHYVVTPLTSLRDSIETISTKSFEMKFASRKDEIGDLTEAISGFLEKVRLELEAVMERDHQRQGYEQSWWQTVLNTAVSKTSRALVVDEDNNVLFANFDLRRADPSQKLHLLDVIDSQQQDVLRLISSAMDSPRETIHGDTTINGAPYSVKVVQLQAEGNIRRTLIMMDPSSRSSSVL